MIMEMYVPNKILFRNSPIW